MFWARRGDDDSVAGELDGLDGVRAAEEAEVDIFHFTNAEGSTDEK
jgi:hypothetical protein